MDTVKTKKKISGRFVLAIALFILICAGIAGVSDGAVIDRYLKAETTVKVMPDGANVTMWAFADCGSDATFTACGAATVPGPRITAVQGDTLNVHVKNSLTGPYTEPVSLHIPGQMALTTPTWTDGTSGNRGADLTRRVRSFAHEAALNSTATYTWNSLRSGTYLYQSATHPAVQVQMGLFGPLTVTAGVNQAYTPSTTNPNTAYDNELVLVYSEIDPALHSAVATNMYGPPAAPGRITSTIGYDPKYFLINEEPYSAAKSTLSAGNAGETTIIRFLNAGLNPHVPVLQGVYMKVIAEDGYLLPFAKEQYSLTLPAGKTIDAIVTLPSAPGYIALYDRMLNLTNGPNSPGGMLAYLAVPAATQHTLTANKVGSGKIVAASAPGGIDCGSDCSEVFNANTVMRLAAFPDPGAYFSGWSGACSGTGDCLVTMNAAKAVTGTFAAVINYNVTPSAGPNGSISPSTVQSVATNNTALFMLYPASHYHIAPVTGTCGGTLSGNQFTTSPVTGNCTVIANFAIDQFTVTPSAGPNGSINPSIAQTVDYNNTTAFTVNANPGYRIQTLTGCGGTLVGNTYTTGPITGNCTVNATFALNTYTVTPSAGPGGSLNPATAQTVAFNSTTAFSVNPNAGFGIASVTGCGGALVGNTYTTGPVTADCTVTATFAALPPLSVVTPNGGETWAAGSAYTIRWSYTGNPGSLVRIELLKGGTVNRTISSGAPVGTGGNGSFNWNIPTNQVTGNDFTMRVTSITNGTFTDTSDANFTITGPVPPTITVTVPNGGENWGTGTTQTINWTYTGNPGTSVRIELLKGGVVNRTINGGTSVGAGGNGSFNWQIPTNQVTGNDFTVRVTSTTNGAYTDTSNANFTITAPPATIVVTQPNGGQNWRRGTVQEIKWNYTGNPGNYVKIELLKGGVLNSTIISLYITSTKTYKWLIPANQATGTDYTVRVTSTTNAAATDTSDANFTIIQ
jgi:hypothetical protein